MTRAERIQAVIGWAIRAVLVNEAIFAAVAANWPLVFAAAMALTASFVPAGQLHASA